MTTPSADTAADFAADAHPFFIATMVLVQDRTADRGREAEELALARLVELPDDPEARAVLGFLALRRGFATEAVRLFESATATDATQATWLYGLALGYRLTERSEESVATFRRALDLNPRDLDVWNDLAVMLRDLGYPQKALTVFEKLVEIKPTHAGAIRRTGTCHEKLGDLDQAEAFYRKAIAVKPDYVEAFINLGGIQAARGAMDAALESYRTAIGLKEDFAPAHGALGMALARLGRRDEAIPELERAIELYPWYADVHRTLMELGHRWA